MNTNKSNKKTSNNGIYTLLCGVKRARLVDGKWQPEYRIKLFGLIPIGWDFYGYEFGDDFLLGLGLTPYSFDTKEECVCWLNAT